MSKQTHGLESGRFDTKEFEIPETLYIRDIDNRVFQNIVAQCLAKIKDVALAEGGFMDNIFGRSGAEGISSIVAEQDNQKHSLRIRIEVDIAYGISIPDKAEEIQTKIAEEITRLTGLHVACVHVVFKDLISPLPTKRSLSNKPPIGVAENIEEEYSDEFK